MTAPQRQNISQQVREIIQRIYVHDPVGCCWHVVLDDDNWDCIDFCREWAAQAVLPDAEYPCCTYGACQELARLDVTPSILARAMNT